MKIVNVFCSLINDFFDARNSIKVVNFNEKNKIIQQSEVFWQKMVLIEYKNLLKYIYRRSSFDKNFPKFFQNHTFKPI